MVIEWLEFKVTPKLREKFIQLDREIWTATLEQYPGFLGKEIWLNPNENDSLFIVIHWQTREQWKSVPQDILLQTETEFARHMDKKDYKLLRGKEYHIRKFSEETRKY